MLKGLLPRKILSVSPPEPSERDKAQALVGKILIGKYRLKAILGIGGMGTVLSAEHMELGNEFAVKVLSEALAANPENVDSFHEEAKKLAALDRHDNIVHVIDVGTDTTLGVHFFIMELLDGQPLDKIIYERRFSLPEAASVISQLASALDFAHERGLIHRDVKPANIFITPTGRAVLTDFGIAIRTAEASKIPGTAGTIAYMSPEQRLMKVVDRRTDIFSLGVVLYEMLTGESYYLLSRGRKRVQSTLQAVSPPEVRTILQRALAEDRNLRYGTASDFANALLTLVNTLKSRQAQSEQRRIFRRRLFLLLRFGAAAAIVGWIIVSIRDSMWPPAEDAIAFVTEEGDQREIWVMNSDGSLQRKLTNDPEDDFKPTWGRDRKAIYFTSVASNGLFIRYIEYHSGEPEVLFSQCCDDIDFSKDNRIAVSFRNQAAKNWDVAIASGESFQTVFSTEKDDFRPRWSPAGNSLVFLSEVDGIVQIFSLSIEGESKPRQITFEGTNWDPRWSPDSNLIVFSSNRTGEYELFIMRPDGSDQHELVKHQGTDFQPSWSPDGSRIAFASDTEGSYDIYVVNADGTGLKRLTDSADDQSMPAWGP
ncbi:MAG TPA: protein kinase [Anaerolineae bacterium]|nr:protein kinase [Anaerolineae bacterium]